MHPPEFLRELLVLLVLGVAVVLLAHRAKLPPIVGFLITGVLSGPYGFGLVGQVEAVEAIAEIGVVLLLFTVGIEVSLKELLRLRTVLLTGGGLQVGVTIAATAAVATLLGAGTRVGIFLGMLVALSSTAIVLRLLADRAELDSSYGRAALAVLIFQDLCVVPMVLLAPVLAGRGEGAGALTLVVLKALGFVGAAVLAARYVVPRLLAVVVGTRKREVFLLTVILLCLGTAWASAQVGLSLALGAFIAGLVISESEYSHQALGEVLPLREVFNSLFFVSIGMLFDVRTVLERPLVTLGAIGGVLLLKTLVTTIAVVAVGQSLRVALIAALALSQIGEFSFVLSKAGLEAGLLDASLYQLFLAVAVGTMALTPALLAAGPGIAAAIERRVPARLSRLRSGGAAPVAVAAPLTDHVVIVGYGVNGRNLARVLGRVGIPFIVVEMNPDVVRAEQRRGRPMVFGDATRPEILEHVGIARARMAVVAISDAAATRGVAALARRLNPHVHIVVRSRYVHEVEPLRALGANEVVPEEFETSIEIFSRVLHRFLVPRDAIEQQIHSIRRDSYQMFRSISADDTRVEGLQRYLTDLSMEAYQVGSGSALVGRALADSRIREEAGVTVVAIHRGDGSTLLNPKGDDRLESDDIVLVLGLRPQITAAARLFRAADAADDAGRG